MATSVLPLSLWTEQRCSFTVGGMEGLSVTATSRRRLGVEDGKQITAMGEVAPL